MNATQSNNYTTFLLLWIDKKDVKNFRNLPFSVVKMLEYEHEPEMEESYRTDFLKSFKKTVEKGFFSFIIVDAVNDKVGG